MKESIKRILGIGLSGGFGAGKYGNTERSGYQGETADYQGPEGKYHDEWFAQQNGGGQELVSDTDGNMGTRVYAGGSLDAEGLAKLGITDANLRSEMKHFLKTFGARSRGDKKMYAVHGGFRYSYEPIEIVQEIPVIAGKEEIRYGEKNSLVFIHFHIYSPIR